MTLRGVLPILLLVSATLAACGSPAAGDAVSPSPRTSAPSQPSATATATAEATVKATPPPAKPTISKAGLKYFFAVALGAEYGDKIKLVTRWHKPEVTVRAHGVTGKHRACLNKVIADFNALTATTDLKLTAGAADIELHAAPLSKFRSLEPRYVAGNDGFVYVHWTDSNVITSAKVLIRSTGIGAAMRCHLIREELTQGMGILRDSGKYPGSIFYGGYRPAPTRYSALDKEVIRLLYSGALSPGDDKKTVTAAVTVK